MVQQPDPKKIQENVQEAAESVKHEVETARQPWYYVSKRARILLMIYAIQLIVFGALTWWVYLHPVNSIDIGITQEFQENPASWLKNLMLAVSDLGAWYTLTALIVLAILIFWVVGLRLEAVFIGGLSLVNFILNTLLKTLVNRARPTANLVTILQGSSGQSFPSGHVMSYLAFWGLLFSFGIILFREMRWWRALLLVIAGGLVALVGLSRIYLGDHWASDVLGAYLIGGVLLGLALLLYLRLKQEGVLETTFLRREGGDRSGLWRTFPRTK